jgi:hypothetical protein
MMNDFTHISRRPTKVLVLVACVAALAATGGTAFGGVRPDDRAGTHGLTVLAGTAIGGLGLSSARPDDRAGMRGTGDARPSGVVRGQSPAPATRPDDRAGFLGEPQAVAATSIQSAGNNFNWGDYGTGVGSGIGLVLIALAAALTLRYRRQTSLTQA